jgi:lipopolysaccharide export LptBFGC system permease protein LptF
MDQVGDISSTTALLLPQLPLLLLLLLLLMLTCIWMQPLARLEAQRRVRAVVEAPDSLGATGVAADTLASMALAVTAPTGVSNMCLHVSPT